MHHLDGNAAHAVAAYTFRGFRRLRLTFFNHDCRHIRETY
jgi:hypothetical protein